MLEALSAQNTMMFKNIVLSSNKKVSPLNHNQFLTSIYITTFDHVYLKQMKRNLLF